MLYNLKGKIIRGLTYQIDKTLSVEDLAADAKAAGDAIAAARKETKLHIENKENPHNVTSKQLGLDLVDNTPDSEKPVSRLQAEAIADAKKAGTDAQAAADNAQAAADNAQSAADNAKAAADNAQAAADNAQAAAKTLADNAFNESKGYTDSKHLSLPATITTTWTGDAAPYTQEISTSGILETDNPHIMPIYDEAVETALLQQESWTMISKGVPAADKIIFYCFEEKPEVEIPIQIEVNR